MVWYIFWNLHLAAFSARKEKRHIEEKKKLEEKREKELQEKELKEKGQQAQKESDKEYKDKEEGKEKEERKDKEGRKENPTAARDAGDVREDQTAPGKKTGTDNEAQNELSRFSELIRSRRLQVALNHEEKGKREQEKLQR